MPKWSRDGMIVDVCISSEVEKSSED